MAVIVSNGNTNISTASGFYRVEAHNLSCYSATLLSLSATRTLTFTPANAGNALGVVICLQSGSNVSSMKSVTVTLKEGVTTRATATLTAAQICNSITSANSDGWFVPFTFSAPYAVTTAPATWTIEITNATGSTDWSVRTSNGTAVTYAFWCDNALSFTANDTIICKDVVTVDQATSIKGTLGTGDATNGIAALICKGSTGLAASVSNFVWASAPATAYTLTVDGLVVFGAHSGFRAGTSALPIPAAQMGTIDFVAPTIGTVNGFADTQRNSTVFGRKSSFFIYGAIPTYERTTLAANAILGGTATFVNGSATITKNSHGYSNDMPVHLTTSVSLPTNFAIDTVYYVVNQATNTFQVSATVGGVAIIAGSAGSGTQAVNPVIVTTDTTSWTVGDSIVVGKRNIKGQGDTTSRTINVISGVNIIPSSGISGATAFSGATVAKLNGYGFYIKQNTASTSTTNYLKCPSNFVISGCQIENFTWVIALSSGFSGDDLANQLPVTVSHCSAYNTLNTTTFTFNISANEAGLIFEYVNAYRSCLYGIAPVTYATTMLSLTCRHNRVMSIPGGSYSFSQTSLEVTGNNIENAGSNILMNGTSVTHTNNLYWGSSVSTSPIYSSFIKPVAVSGNSYQNSTTGLNLGNLTLGTIETNAVFSDSANGTTNTTDIFPSASGLVEYEMASPTGNVNVSTTNIPTLVPGSYIRISDNNDTANDDKGFERFGNTQRTGFSLSDTLVHTTGTTFAAASSGKFALRFQSINGTTPLEFSQKVPTGDIANKTMTVGVWCKINNAAYYAGVDILPKLTVNYDNGTLTTATATAGTSGQYLSLTFTPLTSFGQITVTISSATDATTTNAYVYWDDFSILYPAGVTLNLGGLDLWANALPITPTLATLSAAADVWAVAETVGIATTGSMGALAKRVDVNTSDIPTLL